MRSSACPGLLLCAAVLAAGCETTQPLQVEQQLFDLAFSAGGGSVGVFNVWDLCEDTTMPPDQTCDDVTGDGVPDITLYCEGPLPGVLGPAQSLPWTFTLTVSIVPAGAAEPTVITSDLALVPGTNIAAYDTNVFLGGTPPAPLAIGQTNVTINDGGTPRRFQFQNGRQLTEANIDLITTPGNPLHDLRPALFDGLCPALDVAPPAIIDGEPQPFRVVLNKGDTVIVEARRFNQNQQVSGLVPNPEPALSASVMLDGTVLSEENLVGNTTASNEPGSFITFSFTSN